MTFYLSMYWIDKYARIHNNIWAAMIRQIPENYKKTEMISTGFYLEIGGSKGANWCSNMKGCRYKKGQEMR